MNESSEDMRNRSAVCDWECWAHSRIYHFFFSCTQAQSHFLNSFLLLFKYSCLHFPPPPLSPTPTIPISTTFFKSFYLFIFRERGREGEKEGEKLRCVVVSYASPTGDLACNSGMCPDWELNQQPFGLQVRTQCTGLHQPGHIYDFLKEFHLNVLNCFVCLS